MAVSPAAFTSIFQGVLRWNAFIALAISANLFGREGVTLAAVAIAALISHPQCDDRADPAALTAMARDLCSMGLANNRSLFSTLAGLALNALSLPMPRAITLSLDIIGQCALGTGLILVGAGLSSAGPAAPSAALIFAVGGGCWWRP